MPADYELGADPGDGDDIAVGEFSLADGTVSLILMKQWELRREDFNVAYFGIPSLDGASLTVKVDVFENPAAIAANDLLDYLTLPDFPPLSGDALDRIRDSRGEPDFEKLAVRYRGPSDLAENESPVLRGARMSRIWRRLGLRRPNLIRVLDVTLSINEEDDGSAAARELEGIVDALLKHVAFAESETAADRIAPTETLKLVRPWNAVYLRLPVEARGKHHPKAGGSYAYDHETDDRWTLWVNYDVVDFGPDPVDLQELVGEVFNDPDSSPFPHREVIDRWVDPSPDPTQEAMATVIFKDVQDGEELHHTLWHRVVRQGGQYVMGHFTWVVVDARREEPDMQALTTLVEREVRNACSMAARRSFRRLAAPEAKKPPLRHPAAGAVGATGRWRPIRAAPTPPRP